MDWEERIREEIRFLYISGKVLEYLDKIEGKKIESLVLGIERGIGIEPMEKSFL